MDDESKPGGGWTGESPALDQARLDDVLESISDGFYAVDRDWRYVAFNRAAEEYFGVRRERMLGRGMWDVFPQGRGTRFEHACQAAMDEGAVTRFETPSAVRPDRTVELRIGPLVGGGVTVTLTDITERVRAQEQLEEIGRRHETQAAERAAILEQLAEGVVVADAEGRIVFVNEAAARLHGVRALQTPPEDYSRVYGLFTEDGRPYPPEELPLTRAVREGVAAPETAWRIRRPDGSEVRAVGSARPIRDPSGAQIGAVLTVRDDTERSLAEEHLRLMILELNHRVKNNLATVQAIAVQTLRGTETPEDAREAFLQRITALAAAHDILTREQREGVGVPEIARGVLDALHGDPGRIRMSGPPARLAPKAALSLSMAFHELGTNALKYGALGVAGGEVRLGWRREGQDLVVEWVERGGPAVQAPAARGFGSRLLERGLAAELNGEVRLVFEPEGLRCVIRAPMLAASEG